MLPVAIDPGIKRQIRQLAGKALLVRCSYIVQGQSLIDWEYKDTCRGQQASNHSTMTGKPGHIGIRVVVSIDWMPKLKSHKIEASRQSSQ